MMKLSADARAQKVCDFLAGLDLSERAREVIATTDFNSIEEEFGDFKTAEEVEDYIKYIDEVYGED